MATATAISYALTGIDVTCEQNEDKCGQLMCCYLCENRCYEPFDCVESNMGPCDYHLRKELGLDLEDMTTLEESLIAAELSGKYSHKWDFTLELLEIYNKKNVIWANDDYFLIHQPIRHEKMRASKKDINGIALFKLNDCVLQMVKTDRVGTSRYTHYKVVRRFWRTMIQIPDSSDLIAATLAMDVKEYSGKQEPYLLNSKDVGGNDELEGHIMKALDFYGEKDAHKFYFRVNNLELYQHNIISCFGQRYYCVAIFKVNRRMGVYIFIKLWRIKICKELK